MSERNFKKMMEKKWSENKFVCVGLDSDVWQVPTAHIPHSKHMSAGEVVLVFNCIIVDATKDLVCAYKPNSAFYERYGDDGFRALHDTIAYIHKVAPDVLVILDAKRADISKSNVGYEKATFDFMKADAITVNPYFGGEALQPFLSRIDKGIFVLCRTSNPGAGEFQDRVTTIFPEEADKWVLPQGTAMPFYQLMAYRVNREWNKNGNCALVVGATYPEELRKVRDIVGDDMPILIPGIGAQGGDVEKTVSAGKNSRGCGMIVNSSRGIIFASKDADFAEAARRETEKLHNLINQYR